MEQKKRFLYILSVEESDNIYSAKYKEATHGFKKESEETSYEVTAPGAELGFPCHYWGPDWSPLVSLSQSFQGVGAAGDPVQRLELPGEVFVGGYILCYADCLLSYPFTTKCNPGATVAEKTI